MAARPARAPWPATGRARPGRSRQTPRAASPVRAVALRARELGGLAHQQLEMVMAGPALVFEQRHDDRIAQPLDYRADHVRRRRRHARAVRRRSSSASSRSPTSSRGGMLLKTMFSEVCGTDVHLWHGRLSGVPYPIIPGHVSVGTVAKLRGPITLADGHQAREGDRVVFFDVHRTCGRCYACAVQRHADQVCGAQGLRHHRRGRRRPVRRLERGDLPRARGRWPRCCPTA